MNPVINLNTFQKSLFDRYKEYRENSVSTQRITHNEVLHLTDKFEKNSLFKVQKLGESIDGRRINLLSIGNGGTKILAWTQMHGDEPTATAAIFDLLNFFYADDSFNQIRQYILSKLSINIIPMLNPDGAENHQRENSLNIDINRDAALVETPEAKILFNTASKIKPNFGFNLHDQNSYYTCGRTNKTAAISLLAPPFNYEKSINEARSNSMKVVSKIFDVLSEYIPGQVARYKDDYEPRAFGDNFTNKGISSILIESGFMKDDVDKFLIRKLNFIALLSAFYIIAENDYKSIDHNKYFEIPENETLLFDLLLRNLTINKSGKSYRIDIGINREKFFDAASDRFYYKGKIEQIGDLSIFYGIEEQNFSGYNVEPAKIFPSAVTLKELEKIDFRKLYLEGIAFIKTDDQTSTFNFINDPINIILRNKPLSLWLKTDEIANLVFKKNGNTEFIVVNGFIQSLSSPENSILNGWVID